ncbi:MAG: hypothetical protein ABIZ56_08045 [Chthoniobacteraceae bacterium]
MKPILCSKCLTPLPLELLSTGVPFDCPRCRAALRVSVFPAIHRDIGPGAVAEKAVLDSEATCFFHTDKKAAIVCDDCGRFLCTLCDVPIGGRHICPKCIEAGREKKTLTVLETYRTTYPNMVLTLAILPLLLWPFTLLTAPLAVFLALYGWRKPPSLTGGKRRVSMILALVLALLQCAGWVALGVSIYVGATRG